MWDVRSQRICFVFFICLPGAFYPMVSFNSRLRFRLNCFSKVAFPSRNPRHAIPTRTEVYNCRGVARVCQVYRVPFRTVCNIRRIARLFSHITSRGYRGVVSMLRAITSAYSSDVCIFRCKDVFGAYGVLTAKIIRVLILGCKKRDSYVLSVETDRHSVKRPFRDSLFNVTQATSSDSVIGQSVMMFNGVVNCRRIFIQGSSFSNQGSRFILRKNHRLRRVLFRGEEENNRGRDIQVFSCFISVHMRFSFIDVGFSNKGVTKIVSRRRGLFCLI